VCILFIIRMYDKTFQYTYIPKKLKKYYKKWKKMEKKMVLKKIDDEITHQSIQVC